MITFADIKKDAAKLLNVFDFSADAIIAGKDIDESFIGSAINAGYLEVIPLLRSAYPHFFENKGIMPNWSKQFTAAADSTGSVLNTTTAAFHRGNIGDIVYNLTDSVSAKIIGYTSAFSVTLDTVIDDDWDGDTIYLIGKYLPLDGVDLSTIRRVMVRYEATAEYSEALPMLEKEKIETSLRVEGEDDLLNYSEARYMLSTVKIDDELIDAIRFYPDFTIPDPLAIELTYTEQPAKMVEGNDKPRMPEGHAEFLKWFAIRDACFVREDKVRLQLAERKIEEGKATLLNCFTPLTSDRPKKTPRSSRATLLYNRDI